MAKIIKRDILKELKLLLKEYPVVLILGPRQVGKTTLSKMLKHYQYCNLEDPETREIAIQDPKAFFQSFKKSRVILDEIQNIPTLLSYIQVIVDATQTMGQFILTGSSQMELTQGVTQSLAGRVGILNLFALSIKELKASGIQYKHFQEYIHYGFLPRIHSHQQRPLTAHANYYRTYVERDIRQIINIKNQALLEKFIKLLAGRIGRVINYHSLSNAVGVSAKTIKHWLSILENSFIIYKLNPYFDNFGKRVVKSPKYYFTEVGLLSYLLGIHTFNQVVRDPLSGTLFENLVIMEFIKKKWNYGQIEDFYFFQDSNHNEIDLLLSKNGRLYAFEIKSASTYTVSFSRRLSQIKKMHPKIKSAFIIYNGMSKKFSNHTGMLNFKTSCCFKLL